MHFFRVRLPRPAAALVVLIPGLVGTVATAAHAAETADTPAIWSIQLENDLFTDSGDDQYTHGTRISWMSPENALPAEITGAVNLAPGIDAGSAKRWSLSLGQNMYTPDDLTRDPPDPTDRPYAGWLYASVGIVADTGKSLDNLELSLGVVGPAALAGDAQDYVHRVIGATDPQGWEHQLGNEPGIVLFYEKKIRSILTLTDAQIGVDGLTGALGQSGLAVDATPHAGVALGNVFTHAEAGLMLRFGRDLPQDYGPPRIRPSLPGSDFFEPHRDFGWYLFAGAAGRAVARNIFLDGNSFDADSPQVARRNLVGDAQMGLSVTFGDVRLSFTQIFRTKEFDGQGKPDQFGSINISVRF